MLVGIICVILIGASIGAATGYFGGSSNSKGISSNIDVDNSPRVFYGGPEFFEKRCSREIAPIEEEEPIFGSSKKR